MEHRGLCVQSKNSTLRCTLNPWLFETRPLSRAQASFVLTILRLSFLGARITGCASPHTAHKPFSYHLSSLFPF